MAFVLGAVFLLAFVAAASVMSSVSHSGEHRLIRAFGVQETGIKQSFYAACANAASAAAAATRKPEGAVEVQLALHMQANALQEQMRKEGFDVIFWCGSPSEEERSASAERMMKERRASPPSGAEALSLLSCQQSFLADLQSRKLHFSNLGFSFYSAQLGIGRAAIIPSSYEVDF
ncbi:MAG: hypothetical protein N3E51_00115 [Candidatus Micrarchaeota archaeon]|nr:hypothetical protein [Candidatus Micrarchaeota archaeon]